MPPVALLDADVLYPARLRDLLLSVAEAGLYRVVWTQEILDEMVRNILDDRRDLSFDQLESVVSDMTRAFPEAMISGYQHLEFVMTNHEKDRHVLAAAVHGRTDVIVTRNVKHYPQECSAPHDLGVQTPDQFLLCVHDLRPETFMAGVEIMLARHRKPPKNIPELLESMSELTPELMQRIRSLCREPWRVEPAQEAGGAAWESNPPWRGLPPNTGFEDRAGHQTERRSAKKP